MCSSDLENREGPGAGWLARRWCLVTLALALLVAYCAAAPLVAWLLFGDGGPLVVALAGAAGVALLLLPPDLPGVWGWVGLLRAALPFALASVLDREYGTWLGWVLRTEGHLVLVSLKASLVVAVLLVIFLPVRLVPLIGFWLYMAIAGFCTALTLLDIPFSRRGWSLVTRLQFLLRNWLAMLSFGLVSSLVFLVPILGPIVMVPAASIGGLWLVVRLDKDGLRPLERRRSASPPEPGGP